MTKRKALSKPKTGRKAPSFDNSGKPQFFCTGSCQELVKSKPYNNPAGGLFCNKCYQRNHRAPAKKEMRKANLDAYARERTPDAKFSCPGVGRLGAGVVCGNTHPRTIKPTWRLADGPVRVCDQCTTFYEGQTHRDFKKEAADAGIAIAIENWSFDKEIALQVKRINELAAGPKVVADAKKIVAHVVAHAADLNDPAAVAAAKAECGPPGWRGDRSVEGRALRLAAGMALEVARRAREAR